MAAGQAANHAEWHQWWDKPENVEWDRRERGVVSNGPKSEPRSRPAALLATESSAPATPIRTAGQGRDGFFKAGCEICGTRTARLQKHHIIPREHGGKADPDNMVRVCPACHDWAEPYATDGTTKCRRDVLVLIASHYPFPDRSIASTDAVLCRRHDNWHLWVYGAFGTPPPYPQGGCDCAVA